MVSPAQKVEILYLIRFPLSIISKSLYQRLRGVCSYPVCTRFRFIRREPQYAVVGVRYAFGVIPRITFLPQFRFDGLVLQHRHCAAQQDALKPQQAA